MSPSTIRDEESLAAWMLSALHHPPVRERIAALLEAGSFSRALRLFAGGSEALRSRAERSLSRMRQQGYRLLRYGDPDYPELLARIDSPPIVLTVRGSFLREDQLGLAVVGSRRATAYGRDAAHRLSRDLAGAGLTIVSGLARGIDAAAHEGALEGGGRTVAVLGSGLENLYPREHRRLAERIAERGAILSEFELDEPPHAHNFPRRNRIITGISLGILIVEAAAKSGSLVSARHALEQNRDVFAVPGPIGSPVSEGPHSLIRDGARIVTRAEDVLEELPSEVREALRHKLPPEGGRTSGTSGMELDEEERCLLERLLETHDALDLDHLLEDLSLGTDRALAALLRLEVKDLVSSLPGGLYRARR